MSDRSRTPGADPGRPALSRLVPDLGAPEFAAEVFGRRPNLSPQADPAAFADLFSTDAVDELLAERGLRTPFLRVARNGSTLPESSFTAPGGLGAMVGDQVSDDRSTQLFADGATLVLQGLHRTWRPVIDFGQQLAADLGHPVQANAYVTPPQSQGFSAHYDTHDVFVLQISGDKAWRIHPPVLRSPLRHQEWSARREQVAAAAEAAPLLEVTLRPGDCLYLPRGYLHAATALGASTHLTVGVHVWTGRHVAEELARRALAALDDDESSRDTLPLGIDLTDPGQLAEHVARMAAALTRELGALRPADLGALAEQARKSQRAEPVAPLAQHHARCGLQPTSRIRLRRHLMASLVAQGDGARLVSRAGALTLTAEEARAVRALLEAGRAMTADEVGVELADRLLAAGVVVPQR